MTAPRFAFMNEYETDEQAEYAVEYFTAHGFIVGRDGRRILCWVKE